MKQIRGVEVREVIREAFGEFSARTVRILTGDAKDRRVVVVAEVHRLILEAVGTASPADVGRTAILRRHRPDPDVLVGFRMPHCVWCSSYGPSMTWPCPDYRDAATRPVAELVAHQSKDA